jgi:hypothetical protein
VMHDHSWLPSLLQVDFSDLVRTLDRAETVFERDFGNHRQRPLFRGQEIRLKRHPLRDGRSSTFWHLVTSGSSEPDRPPVRERLERIGWPRAVLNSAADPTRVRVWKGRRKNEERWYLALADFSYLVILAQRNGFVLLWTAYAVVYDSEQSKYRREYAAWRKQQGLKD